MKSKKIRTSNIEVLRILAMLMIISSHLCNHSKLEVSNCSIVLNRLFVEANNIAYIGVDIFVIISGYYLCKVKSVKIKKILGTWFGMLTYSILCYLGLCILNTEEFCVTKLLKSLLPFSTTVWWFATAYLLLVMFSPLINIILDNISYRKQLLLVGISVLLWSIIPTFIYQEIAYSDFLWFVLLYQIGAIISKSSGKIKKIKHFFYLVASICIYILNFFAIVLDEILNNNWGDRGTFGVIFIYRNSTMMLLCAVFLFLFFISITEFSNKFVNYFASGTLGIYLLHDNPYVREWFWGILPTKDIFMNKYYFIPYVFVVTISVYLICFFIEQARLLIAGIIVKRIEHTKLYLSIIEWSKKNGQNI